MRNKGIKSWYTEGYENLEWVIIDYVNIVAHIFSKNARNYYEFERLWADGKIIKVKNIE